MDFANADLMSLLATWVASSELYERAEAHNIRFEERLHSDRLSTFERGLSTPCTDYMTLRDHLSDYVRTYVEVGLPHVPATFSANSTAMILPSPEQKLVRIENITRHLINSGLTAAELERSLASSKPAKSAIAESFLDHWNLHRDSRPSFAAFKDQLLTEISDTDWPHKLRDRLGLRARPLSSLSSSMAGCFRNSTSQGCLASGWGMAAVTIGSELFSEVVAVGR